MIKGTFFVSLQLKGEKVFEQIDAIGSQIVRIGRTARNHKTLAPISLTLTSGLKRLCVRLGKTEFSVRLNARLGTSLTKDHKK